jgi:hypothetical protein
VQKKIYNPNHQEDKMIKLKKITFVMAILAALALMGETASANLITNGGFEDTVQANGTWAIYTSLPSWESGIYGIELRNNVAGVAYEGNNFIELDTTHNSLAYQNILTGVGQQYALTFAYSPREGVAGASNGIEVYWDSLLVGSFTGTGSNSGNTWEIKNLILTSNGTTSRLEFRATGTDDSYGGSLDAVSLEARRVPEPATMLFLSIGLVGLAVARRSFKN